VEGFELMADRLRLVSFVHVRDADGNAHAFGPDDDIPDWARVKITNPAAWGFNVLAERGPSLEHGTPQEGWGDGLPSFIDVVCNHCDKHGKPLAVAKGAKRQLVARFETVMTDRLEWWWNAALAMHRSSDYTGLNQAGTDQSFTVDPDRAAITYSPDGEKQMRLHCRLCRADQTFPWAEGTALLDSLRVNDVSQVDLRALLRTMSP